jgi:hypothetical protein
MDTGITGLSIVRMRGSILGRVGIIVIIIAMVTSIAIGEMLHCRSSGRRVRTNTAATAEVPMPEASLAEVILNAVHGQYDAVLTEPRPQRWLELLGSADCHRPIRGSSDRDETEGMMGRVHPRWS